MTYSIKNFVNDCKELKILYVEDNPEARKFTTKMLSNFFSKITVANDGKEGLKKFKNSDFDIIITDINMPNMNGIEMATEIKKINNNIPILIISAHNEMDYFISSIKVGIDGYLIKPLKVNQLIETLSKSVKKVNMQKDIELYQEELRTSNLNLEDKVNERTAQLEYRLYHDHLTELENHASMMKTIESSSFEVLFLININGFQNINDIYGLNAGNTVLKKFAKILQEFNSDERYKIYRVYGDEFVLYRGKEKSFYDEFEEDKKKVLTYLESIKIHLDVIDEYIDIEPTIGVSVNEKNPFIKADMALKHAKKEHKQIVIYTQDIDNYKQLANDIYWKKEIKTALNSDNIVPVFQGIVDKSGKIIKYETLMRLAQYKDGEEQLISPIYFLTSAVKTQQYAKLTKAIVQKSFEIMKNRSIDFSINLSFSDLSDPIRVKYLQDKMKEYGVEKRVIFEILESEIVSDYKLVLDVIKSFKEQGVRVAIDDFGSGYSNFEHILKLEPDYIKIDASLIKNILIDESSFTLVRAISEFSKELGIKVIAEFVSSKEIFEILKSLSIDEYQGYYFSIPSKDIIG